MKYDDSTLDGQQKLIVGPFTIQFQTTLQQTHSAT